MTRGEQPTGFVKADEAWAIAVDADSLRMKQLVARLLTCLTRDAILEGRRPATPIDLEYVAHAAMIMFSDEQALRAIEEGQDLRWDPESWPSA
jgi:hypothetical protein